MVKVTLNENLVPCAREKWVKGNPYSDLTYNVLHARKLIRAAARCFSLGRGSAVFSGYINEHAEGSFQMNLWEGDALLRRLTLEDLGYAGVLHIEIEGAGAIGDDVFQPIERLPAVAGF